MRPLPSLGIVALLIGCSAGDASPPAKPPVKSFVRARVRDYTHDALSQVGLNELVFDYSLPENTRCTVWMKTYVGGKLDRQLCQIQKCSTGAENMSGQLVFNRYDPSAVTETSSLRTKWVFGMKGWSSSWVDDPLKKTDGQMPFTYNQENLELGRTYNVACIVGATKDAQGSTSFSAEGGEKTIAAKAAVAVFIKVRLDPSDSREDTTIMAQVPDFDETP